MMGWSWPHFWMGFLWGLAAWMGFLWGLAAAKNLGTTLTHRSDPVMAAWKAAWVAGATVDDPVDDPTVSVEELWATPTKANSTGWTDGGETRWSNEPILAWRCWYGVPSRTEERVVMAGQRGVEWTEARMTAVCLGAGYDNPFAVGHRVPHTTVACNECGIYASRTYQPLGGFEGVVALSGKVVVGERGYRAEHAEIVALSASARYNRSSPDPGLGVPFLSGAEIRASTTLAPALWLADQAALWLTARGYTTADEALARARGMLCVSGALPRGALGIPVMALSPLCVGFGCWTLVDADNTLCPSCQVAP